MIAISATGKKLTTSMDLRFGRCPYFLITDGTQTHFIENKFSRETNQVGRRVVELLKEAKVTQVITGEIGPLAKKTLEENQIQIIMLSEDKISLQHILKKMHSSQTTGYSEGT